MVLATSLASALYAFLFVTESVEKDPNAKLITIRHHKAVWHIFSTGASEGGGRFPRCKLWLYMLCFFLVVSVHIGSRELYVLYELSPPLCWGPTFIGYGSAALHLCYLSSLLGLKVMLRWLDDSWVAVISLVSNITGLLVFSVADSTLLMFTGDDISLTYESTSPGAREKLFANMRASSFSCVNNLYNEGVVKHTYCRSF